MNLWKKIFGKKEKNRQETEEIKEMPIKMPVLKGESLAIYNTLLNGLHRMEKEGINRIYVCLEEMKPDERAFGNWIDSDKLRYYPYEILDPREKEAVLKENHYSAGFLVGPEIPGVIKHPGYGFEVIERTHFHPMLHQLKDNGETKNKMEYYRNDCFYDKEQIKLIAEQMANAKATAKEIEGMIEDGIKNYHQVTKELMEKAGVFKSLESLEKRIELNPTEEILSKTREQINSAGYKK